MTTIELKGAVTGVFSLGHSVSATFGFSSCRPTSCVFSYFILICHENLDSRLFALNKVEASLNHTLSKSSHFCQPENLCDCFFTGQEQLIRAFIGCVASEHILLRRSSTHCLRLLCRILVSSRHPVPYLTDFISFLVKQGLSPSVHYDVKLSLCTALPQIFTKDIFESYKPRNQAVDFEPLFRTLLHSYTNTCGNKSPFKQAFSSLLRHLGAETYCLIVRQWENMCVDGVLPFTTLHLAQSWADVSFPSRLRTSLDAPIMSVSPREQSRSVLDPSCHATVASDELIVSAEPPMCIAELGAFLSRKSCDVLYATLSPNCSRITETYRRSDAALRCAIEELRDSVITKMASPAGWNLCLGIPGNTSVSHLSGPSHAGFSMPTTLVALLVLLEHFIQDEDFTVIVCCLEIATAVVQPFAWHDFQLCEQESSNDSGRSYIRTVYDYVVSKFITLLQIAFAHNNIVVRISASNLLLAIARVSTGPMLIVQRLFNPILRFNNDLSLPSSPTHDCHPQKPKRSHDRLCQELIDMLTSMLLMLPSSSFDLVFICDTILLNGLLIRQPSVRAATLDCISVVAHILGPGNLSPLLAAVSEADSRLSKQSSTRTESHATDSLVNTSADTGSLLEAVQLRLARRQLPQLDSQGRVIRSASISATFGYSVADRDGSTGSLDYNGSGTAIWSADPVTCAPDNFPNSTPKYAMKSTTLNQSVSKGLRRRPSAVFNPTRLPWNPRTVVHSSSVASSSGVSSITSPRGPDSNSSSATGARTAFTAETESERERDTTPGCASPDFIPLKFPGPQAPKAAQLWPTDRSRRSSRATASKHDSNRSHTMHSRSVPSSGRLSPISVHDSPMSVERSLHFPHKPRCIPDLRASDVGPCTPRRKPVLAPLKHKAVPDCLLPLFSTRPTLGRQSGRSWQSSTTDLDRNSYTESTVTPSSEYTNRSQRDHSPPATGANGRSSPRLYRIPSTPADAEIYDDDYEEDDVPDMGDIIDDDDSSTSTCDGLGSSRGTTGRRSEHNGQRRTPTDGLNAPNKRSSLCRSIDSELSGVTTIRSAASHRRALRLFEEAERRRRMEESNADAGSGDCICEPARVSNVDSCCPIPTLAPDVSPALSAFRTTHAKTSSQRRGIQPSATSAQQPSSVAATINLQNCPVTSSASQSSGSVESTSSSNSNKYNPYKGASFRENPGYSGLVIGRAATSTVSIAFQSLQSSSIQDLQRPSHFPPTGERKPLKGQHNIHIGLTPNAHTDAATTVVATGAITSSSLVSAEPSPSINVVGRGLFGHHPSVASTPFTSKPHTGLDASVKTDRIAPPGPNVIEHNHLLPGSESNDDRPIKPSVLGFTNLGSSIDYPNTDSVEISSTNNLRQRASQRKTSELQRLKKRPNVIPCRPAGDEEAKGESNDSIPPVDGNQVSRVLPSATWPPPGRLHSSPSHPELDTTVEDSLPSTDKRTSLSLKLKGCSDPAALPKSRRSGSHQPPVITSTEKQRNPIDEKILHAVQSAENVTGGSQGTACKRSSPTYSGSEKADFPPVKGRSNLSVRNTCSSLQQALQFVSSEDWEAKVSGLEAIAQIALDKPSTFCPTGDNLHGGSGSACSSGRPAQSLNPAEALNQAVQAVVAECRNLRSQVSRQAVHTLGSMFRGLGRAMDPHVELCIRILLGKTGEAAAAFLRDEVAVTMMELTQAANASRVLAALLQHGLGHKNAAVRLQTAMHISQIVESGQHQLSSSQHSKTTCKSERDRPSGSLSGSSYSVVPSSQVIATAPALVLTSGLMERLVIALSQFLTDGNQETRYYGRRLLRSLVHHTEFERSVRKHLSGQMLRVVHEAMEQVRTKGIGEPPNSSFGVRRRGCSPSPNQQVPRGSSNIKPS